MAQLDNRPIAAAESDRQRHPVARFSRNRLGQFYRRWANSGFGLFFVILTRFGVLFGPTLFALLGRRIGIADWPETLDFRLREKRQYGFERILVTLDGEAEKHIARIRPIEPALGV